METLPIYYNIKDLIEEDKWKKIEDKYSCSICSDSIYNRNWYQCKEGHTACDICWVTIMFKGSKQCHSCRTPIIISLNGEVNLSRCRFIENEFKNTKINCPYAYNKDLLEVNNKLEFKDKYGCKDIIKLNELKEHLNICNYRFVKCKNNGCDKISRYQIHLKHQLQCKHAFILCELCFSLIQRSELTSHQEICPSVIVTCRQCPEELMRCDLDSHVNNECPNTIIQCRFKEYGCNHEIKRSEISSHLEQVNHTIFMLKLIDYQTQQINELQQINKSYIKKLKDFKNQVDILNDKNNSNIKKSYKQPKEAQNKCNDLFDKLFIK